MNIEIDREYLGCWYGGWLGWWCGDPAILAGDKAKEGAPGIT
jgi:hypothetical protein